MVGLDQQSVPKQLINEVPSHVVLVNNKVGTLPISGHKVSFLSTGHDLSPKLLCVKPVGPLIKSLTYRSFLVFTSLPVQFSSSAIPSHCISNRIVTYI